MLGLTASMLPPLFLAACMLGKSNRWRWLSWLSPLVMSARVEDGVEHLDLTLRSPWTRTRLLCFSDKFSAVQVMQRVSVWVDLSLGWGLLHPPTALAGLYYVTVELLTYRKAMQVAKLQFRSKHQTAWFPRSMMEFWLMMMSVLVAVHFGYTAWPKPCATTVGVTLMPMVIVWIGSFLISRRCQEKTVSEDALELVALSFS
eukprot:TRINITY_DN65587_c0_g1_i2.p1 TRINITY_DN65587_c0_g1~~TRINITY_DN65587_c0_g1_i2.p1  ORF type:complete len:201 (+),score=21.31 TRINITY_DN65587_c0_g1_i2:111-713(+)